MMTRSKQNWETKNIPIKDLLLWDENSRIPDYMLGGDEYELIQTLLKKYDLENLAKDFIKDADLPQLEKLVVWRNKNQLVVLEGNRRLATYKCLVDPSIISDDDMKDKFESFKKQISIDKYFRLEALITSTKKEGMRYIERKHYYGNNEKRWEQYERDHYIKRTRDTSADSLSPMEKDSIFRANFADKVKLVDLPNSFIQSVLGRGYATNLYRVVGGNEGRKKLKYERLEFELRIEDESEFLKLLKIIVYNIVKKKSLDGARVLNSRTLNKERAIREYLGSISPIDVDEVDRLIKEAQSTERKKKKKGKKSSQKRKRSQTNGFLALIDPKLVLPRNASDKVKAVFQELQKINVSECPHASSILVRILIEVATVEYLKKKKETKQLDLRLVKKIDFIKDNYVNDRDLKRTIEQLHNDLLTKTLNQVAHNTLFLATETSIKDLWINVYTLFKFLVPGVKTN